jgi:hypothetical protein
MDLGELTQNDTVLVVRDGAKASVALHVGTPEPGKTKLELSACVGMVHWMVKQLRPIEVGVSAEGLLREGIKDVFKKIGRSCLKQEVVVTVDAPQTEAWKTRVESTFDEMLQEGSIVEDGVRERVGTLYKLVEQT